MNKLGIFMNFWENDWNADHVKYLKKAKEIGFDILEFQAQPLREMSQQRLTEMKAVAAEYDIEMTYSLGLDKAYDISSSDESIRQKGIQYLTEIMEKVAFLNGRIISGVSYAGWGVPDAPHFTKEELTHNSILSMKKISKIAESLGITYGVEAVNRFEGVVLNTAKEAVNYVKAVDSANVGVLLDTYHMNIEEKSFREAILTAGDLLVGFHTGDNNRCIPGKGHIDWEEIFQALADINYTGQIVSEPFVMRGGQVGRDIYVWRDLVEDTSEQAIDREAAELLAFEKRMLKAASKSN